MSLKSVAQYIKDGQYEQAEKEIQTLEKSGNDNIKLFLFGILVSVNLKKDNSALNYLNKARSLDPKGENTEIDRAECAIYETFPESLNKDRLAVLNKIINDEKTTDAKRKKLQEIKWVSMLRWGQIQEFCQLPDVSEAVANLEVSKSILNMLTLGKKIPVEMAQKAFLCVKDQLPKNEHRYGTLLFLREPNFSEYALQHALRFGCDDPNVFKSVYSQIALDLIQCGKPSFNLAEAVKIEGFIPLEKPTTLWLTHLFASEIALAYDAITKLSSDEYRSWSLCGLAFFTYYETRQFSKAIKVYRSCCKSFPDLEIFKILEIRAMFENYGDQSELKQILKWIEKSEVKENEDVIETKLRIKILLKDCTEEEIENSNLTMNKKYSLLAELNFLLKNYGPAQWFTEKFLESDTNEKDQWRVQLLNAKIKWMVNDDVDEAESDLRQLYSQNPFVADIVAALAEFNIAMEDYESAKRLIDHAVLLNPSRKDFRELQDNAYALLDISLEDRIHNLNEYIAVKPYCMWAVRHVTSLEIQSGQYENAVNKLRRIIHAFEDDVDIEIRKSAASIWAYVGLVNFHRGQAKSAMYAFESAVNLEPENPSFLLQLAVSQKNLYKFEEVFATLKILKSISASSEIRTNAHYIFLESVILYASQITPGKAQLHQLLVFFKIIDAMSVVEWVSSRALLLSVANALALLREYNDEILRVFLSEISTFASKFSLGSKESLLNAEVAILLNLLSAERSIGALNEAGTRVLNYAIKNDSPVFASVARRFFRNAIVMSGQSNYDRSILYTNLGLTFCYGRLNYSKALHCFLRSIQLDKNNFTALALTGFICLKVNNIKDATQAFNLAHVLEPLQVYHWYGRAILAELEGSLDSIEVLNNFQHSLTIKPCVQAVEAFSYYLVKRKALKQAVDRFDFDFTTVKHLLYVNERSDNLLYALAVIAEYNRHFNEARTLIRNVSPSLSISDSIKARILIPTENSQLTSNEGLGRLNKIYHGSLVEAVVASGLQSSILISYLLNSLSSDDWNIFWKFFRANFYPLLVAFVNVLHMDSLWSRGIIATLRTKPHKLLEVFPRETPKHEYASTSRPREDENAFVRFDPAVEPLYELLSLKKAEHDLNKAPSSSEEDIVLLIPSGSTQNGDSDLIEE